MRKVLDFNNYLRLSSKSSMINNQSIIKENTDYTKLTESKDKNDNTETLELINSQLTKIDELLNLKNFNREDVEAI